MKEMIKKLLFKLGLKKYQWKFITRYIIQTKNRILYSNSKRAEKYIEKEFKEALGYEINFKEKSGGGVHLIKRYNVEDYTLTISYIQNVQINI